MPFPPAVRLLNLLWDTPSYYKWAAGAAAYGWGRDWWKKHQQRLLSEAARAWPQHRARVVAVQAVHAVKDDNEKAGWSGLLTYSYFVEGEVEVGEFLQPFESEQGADEWVRALQDKSVTVAVDPVDRRRSIWIEEEVAAARLAVSQTLGQKEPAALSSWLEILRLVTLMIAIAGTITAVWKEAMEILAVYGHAIAPRLPTTGALAICAIVCMGVSIYVFAKRFPGRLMGAVADQFSDPVVKGILKVLGFVESSVLVYFFLHMGAGETLISAARSNAMMSVVWAGLFAGAAVTLWVCGRRLPVKHELAPGLPA